MLGDGLGLAPSSTTRTFVRSGSRHPQEALDDLRAHPGYRWPARTCPSGSIARVQLRRCRSCALWTRLRGRGPAMLTALRSHRIEGGIPYSPVRSKHEDALPRHDARLAGSGRALDTVGPLTAPRPWGSVEMRSTSSFPVPGTVLLRATDSAGGPAASRRRGGADASPRYPANVPRGDVAPPLPTDGPPVSPG